jgi:hypothetical protein
MDRTRGSDFRSLATALFVIEKYYEPGPKGKELKNAGTLPQLEKWLCAGDKVSQPYQDDIHSIFKTFLALVISKDPSVKEVFKTRVAPIEFIFISLLIAVLRKEKVAGKGDLKEIAERIREMREYVREEHVDIRANSKVGGTLMEFVRGISSGNGSKGKGKGKGAGAKRKRRQDDSEQEEGEYEEPATKKPTATSGTPRKTMNSSNSTKTHTAPKTPFVAVPATKTTTITPLPDRLAAIRAAKSQDAANRANAYGGAMHAPAAGSAGGLPSPRSSHDNASSYSSTSAAGGTERDRGGDWQSDEFNSRGAYSDRERERTKDRGGGSQSIAENSGGERERQGRTWERKEDRRPTDSGWNRAKG